MVKSSYLEELDVSLNVFIVKFALFNELELFEDFALDHGNTVLLDHLRFNDLFDQVPDDAHVKSLNAIVSFFLGL